MKDIYNNKTASERGLVKNIEIQKRIYTIRNVQVMLDKDLAIFYDVKPIRLREQVKRNIKRFPFDFMFQLTEQEADNMVSQNAIPSKQKLIIKLNRFFNAIESKEVIPKQGIFFDGQIFDAYKFVSDLIRSAEKSIVIIDNYIDETVLSHLTKRNKEVKAVLLTERISKQLALDIKKFNEQYPAIDVKEFKISHDRFIIIDKTEVYHFGASLKDLGKKWFAFSRMDIGAVEMVARLVVA